MEERTIRYTKLPIEFTNKRKALKYAKENWSAVTKHPKKRLYVVFDDSEEFLSALKAGYEIVD